MDTASILFVAIFFAGMGVWGLVSPASLARHVGLAVTDAHGTIEMRAVYGGFGGAIGGALAHAAFEESTMRAGVLTAVAIALLGMAGGRVVALLVERPKSLYPGPFFFLVETGLAAVLLAAR